MPRRLTRLPARDLLGGLRLAEARGTRARMAGLSYLDEPPPGHALRFPRCGSVHTFGMRFALDVIFLDRDDRVIRVARGVPPRRFVSARRARTVIETRAGEADRFLAAGAADGGEPRASDGPRRSAGRA